MSRYARQIALPGVGAQGQARLAGAYVTVVGAGGLGCPVLQYLSGAGVGRIRIIDPDRVEESNLHRQPLYRMSDLGRPKVLAARDHLCAANPGSKIEACHSSLHPGNAARHLRDADVVIDAADSFAVSYTLSDLCLRANIPLISGSALGLRGYVGGFCAAAPSLRAVFPELPGSGATCASAGVMGPLVGAIGALQAQMALQVLLGLETSPLGRIMTVDMQTMQLGGFTFHGATEPDFLVPFLALQEVCVADRLIDLRDTDEAPAPLLPQAERRAPDRIDEVVPDPDRRVVLCCATGLRAWRAAARLYENGHRNLALVAASACA